MGTDATLGPQVMEVDVDMLTCQVTEGLTEDAVSARLHQGMRRHMCMCYNAWLPGCTMHFMMCTCMFVLCVYACVDIHVHHNHVHAQLLYQLILSQANSTAASSCYKRLLPPLYMHSSTATVHEPNDIGVWLYHQRLSATPALNCIRQTWVKSCCLAVRSQMTPLAAQQHAHLEWDSSYSSSSCASETQTRLLSQEHSQQWRDACRRVSTLSSQ